MTPPRTNPGARAVGAVDWRSPLRWYVCERCGYARRLPQAEYVCECGEPPPPLIPGLITSAGRAALANLNRRR